ncbi:hypothetical protein BVG19_g3780 [[Candida] boidinii]|nr:hypothetical protein BVG19_g3780 [[Candida] boidinii]OWB52616.1 hypothetical protein B5S27_g4193 [[Candida] boidinii]
MMTSVPDSPHPANRTRSKTASFRLQQNTDDPPISTTGHQPTGDSNKNENETNNISASDSITFDSNESLPSSQTNVHLEHNQVSFDSNVSTPTDSDYQQNESSFIKNLQENFQKNILSHNGKSSRTVSSLIKDGHNHIQTDAINVLTTSGSAPEASNDSHHTHPVNLTGNQIDPNQSINPSDHSMDITEDGTTILPNKGGIHVTPNFSQSNSNPTNLPPVHENDNNSNAHTIINNETMPQPNSGTGSSENLAESGANNSPDAYDGTPYSQAALGITRADIEHALLRLCYLQLLIPISAFGFCLFNLCMMT